MALRAPTSTVHRIRFDDLSGNEFERLVFAFLLRTHDWVSLDWYGQAGGDAGRDIWGVLESDLFPKGQTVCALCANWQNLTIAKVKKDLKKLKVGAAGLPDKCIVIGGGTISATLRDEIKAEATAAGINNSEVWSGVEFEERLRTKAESLLRRFTNGEQFPDSPKHLQHFVGTLLADTDEERLALMASLFDRPAFYTPFRHESNIPAFQKAITDTIEALGTGVHRLRDGTEIRRIPSRHTVKSPEIKAKLSAIEKQLTKLRATFERLLAEKEIRPCGCGDPNCGTFQPSHTAIQQMDSIRTGILETFRKLYPQFGVRVGL